MTGIQQGPFLTAIDPRAKVKGSRDPLGLQAVWVGIGRSVVGNLTTVSTSARDFTVLMLGAYFVEKVKQRDSEESDTRIFLRFEQLAAYTRVECLNMRSGFRGVERASQYLDEPPMGTVTLSAESSGQILQNQKAYGLWGLFAGPGRESGMLDQNEFRLSTAAREHLRDGPIKKLRSVEEHIINMLMKDGNIIRVEKGGADRKALDCLAKCLAPEFTSDEKDFYWQHLVLLSKSDSTQGRQQRLVRLLEPNFERQWNLSLLQELKKKAQQGNDSDGLSKCLEQIVLCDSLIAPASRLFAYILGCDGISKDEIVARIEEQWGKSIGTPTIEQYLSIHSRFCEAHPGVENEWKEMVGAFSDADYDRVIDCLITINGQVMQERGGTPWAEFKGGFLNVRFHDEESHLPSPENLREKLRFSYFIDSLTEVARQIQGGKS